MIGIKLFKNQETINKIEVNGHSGYADAGEDIICASISVLMFTLIESMDGVLKLSSKQYTYKIDPRVPFMSLEIKYDKLSNEEINIAKALTDTFELGVIKSSEDYRDFVEISIQEV